MFQTTRVRVLYAKKIQSGLLFAGEVDNTKATLMFREVVHEEINTSHTQARAQLHEQFALGGEVGVCIEIMIGPQHEEVVHKAQMSECFCPIVCCVLNYPSTPRDCQLTDKHDFHTTARQDKTACQRAAKRQRPF